MSHTSEAAVERVTLPRLQLLMALREVPEFEVSVRCFLANGVCNVGSVYNVSALQCDRILLNSDDRLAISDRLIRIIASPARLRYLDIASNATGDVVEVRSAIVEIR